MRGREANPVFARVCGTEGEAAFGCATGVDNAMVVVEDFVDSDGHAEGGGGLEGGKIGVVLFGFVISWMMPVRDEIRER